MKLEGKSTPDIENNTHKDVSRNNLCQPWRNGFLSAILWSLSGNTPRKDWQEVPYKTKWWPRAEDLGCGFGARPSFCQERMWPQRAERPWNPRRLVVPWYFFEVHPPRWKPSPKKKWSEVTGDLDESQKNSRLLLYKVIGRFHGKCWIVHSVNLKVADYSLPEI